MRRALTPPNKISKFASTFSSSNNGSSSRFVYPPTALKDLPHPPSSYDPLKTPRPRPSRSFVRVKSGREDDGDLVAKAFRRLADEGRFDVLERLGKEARKTSYVKVEGGGWEAKEKKVGGGWFGSLSKKEKKVAPRKTNMEWLGRELGARGPFFRVHG